MPRASAEKGLEHRRCRTRDNLPPASTELGICRVWPRQLRMVAAEEERASWIVTTTQRSFDSSS